MRIKGGIGIQPGYLKREISEHNELGITESQARLNIIKRNMSKLSDIGTAYRPFTTDQ